MGVDHDSIDFLAWNVSIFAPGLHIVRYLIFSSFRIHGEECYGLPPHSPHRVHHHLMATNLSRLEQTPRKSGHTRETPRAKKTCPQCRLRPPPCPSKVFLLVFFSWCYSASFRVVLSSTRCSLPQITRMASLAFIFPPFYCPQPLAPRKSSVGVQQEPLDKTLIMNKRNGEYGHW